MTETAYQAVPEIGADERAAHAGTVVMKFGGTSVEGPDRLKAVARRLVGARERGDRVVGVLSAMGDTTDELVALAHQVSPQPDARELDMLISVGERISCALAAKPIHEALDDGQIVLVAGFQGVSSESFDVTTLGRGGSDTTAVALAAALGADVCEMNTDVEGIFTADPRFVPNARKLHALTYD